MDFISRHLCKTQDLGVNDNLYGGTLLAWLDSDVATYCSEMVDSADLVTRKIEFEFSDSVKVGQIVHILGEIEKIGTTSVVVKILVHKHDPETGDEDVVGTGKFVFVRVNRYGKTRKITPRVKERIENKKKEDEKTK